MKLGPFQSYPVPSGQLAWSRCLLINLITFLFSTIYLAQSNGKFAQDLLVSNMSLVRFLLLRRTITDNSSESWPDWGQLWGQLSQLQFRFTLIISLLYNYCDSRRLHHFLVLCCLILSQLSASTALVFLGEYSSSDEPPNNRLKLYLLP